MNRDAFVTICNVLAITLRIAGYQDTARQLRGLMGEASRKVFWNPKAAVGALMEALDVMQDELAAKLEHH